MTMTFEETATREHVWLRGFFMGPTGSGKSKGSLELATRLGGGGIPITLINTERGRGKLYADRYTYALIDLSGDGGGDVDHDPAQFVKAIDMAEAKRPGGTIILDSASHEWMGKNGVLQQADRFGEWKTVRPKHNAFVERLMAVQGHVIVCVRAKMKYEVSEIEDGSRKRQVITMLGVGPIQSDDMQYEFNLVARFDQQTKDATFSGHVDPLDGTVSQLVGEPADAVAEALGKWLSEGAPPQPPESASDEAIKELTKILKEEGHSDEVIEGQFATVKGQNRGVLPPDWVARNLTTAQERIAAKKQPDAAEPKPDEVPKAS